MKKKKKQFEENGLNILDKLKKSSNKNHLTLNISFLQIIYCYFCTSFVQYSAVCYLWLSSLVDDNSFQLHTKAVKHTVSALLAVKQMGQKL